MTTLDPPRNRFCLLRHGESEANVHGRIDSDPTRAVTGNGLTELGVRQALDAAARLQTTVHAAGGVVLVTSDFLRARQTAEVIAAKLEVAPPIIDPRLRERGCLAFHGRPSAEFRKTVWAADARGEELPECEGLVAVVARLAAVVRECEVRYANRLVVLVTHCDPARIFLAKWTGSPVARHFELDPLPTGGWSLLPAVPHPSTHREVLCGETS